jgi:hypothetical protein
MRSSRREKGFIVSVVCPEILLLLDTGKGFLLEGDEFVQKLKLFTKLEWTGNQSFCYKDYSSIEVQESLSVFGVCYTFNGRKNLVVKET